MSDPRRFDPNIDGHGVLFMMPNALGAYTTYTEWQMVQRDLTTERARKEWCLKYGVIAGDVYLRWKERGLDRQIPHKDNIDAAIDEAMKGSK